MKTVCIYHSIDLDGWMSAAIVKHYYKLNSKKYLEGDMEDIADNDSIAFIGYNYGQPIPDLSEYSKVIMCDISFPESEMYKLCITKDFIWNDHHASALAMYEEVRKSLPENGGIYYAKGLRGVQFAACELTWQYFFPNEPMPEIVRLLGRYDCFGHKGTDEEKYVLEFQYGARQCISNYKEAYAHLIDEGMNYKNPEVNTLNIIYDKGKAIYSYLKMDARQSYQNGFEIILEEPMYFESGTVLGKMTDGNRARKFICFNKERFNPINFGIDYHADGYDGAACFYYADGKWKFSIYNDDGSVDCSVIAKQFGGGGHKGAAEFILNTKEFNNLIK